MHEEPTYAAYPAAPFASGAPELLPLPLATPSHSTVDFDAMKRQFEATSISGPPADKKRSQSHSHTTTHMPPPPPPVAPSSPPMGHYPMGGYPGDIYAAAGGPNFGHMNGLTMYGAFGPGAPPFVPQAQQQALALAAAANATANGLGHSQPPSRQASSHGYQSGSTSPYLGLSPNPSSSIPFGSPPLSHAQLPAHSYASSYNGAYDTMPSSPNPYAQQPNPYAFGALGFGGVQPYLGMMPGLLGLSSPQLGGSMQMQQGMPGMAQFPMQFPAMNPSLGGANQGVRPCSPRTPSQQH